MNTYLKYQPPGVQFFAFLGLAGGFIVLNSLLTHFFFSDLTAVLLDKTATIKPEMVVQFKAAQAMSAIISFLLPALLLGYFSSPKALPYIGVQPRINVLLVLVSLLFLVAVQPFVGWIGSLNSKINFGSLQQTMQETEATYNRALQAFLKMRGVGDVLINLVIMALLPAIAEEAFFRGAFQKVLLRLTKMPVVAIVFSASIFALLHGTIFKFLPIFTLGLMLGVIYHVTRNLWYTIIIHFMNNGLAVLTVYFSPKYPMLEKLANDEVTVQWYTALLSLAVAIGFILFMYNKSLEVLPASTTEEDIDYIA
ncbi:CPBP family intramembrane glutamic endopeptidase [Aridibaculum aurantiacum]|uniref:CPBP family intramembrane glutamic endopeptidase n=1 Tax=Aridibaculum aurantiacum TaxID=2810307 RepID=UPI001A97D301|nr:CPBP family intramembrane glutamic endopeptidase [Aridibaculum aurantiacum]